MLNDKTFAKASILMIQDPWWGVIGRNKSVDPNMVNIYGTTNSPHWICFTPPGINGPKGPGVSIYVCRDIPGLIAWFSDLLPPHPNILTVNIIYKGSITTLVNIYLHGDAYKDSLLHLIQHPIDPLHPISVAGDFNTHHPNWALKGSIWEKTHPNPDACLLEN
ncbi:unnamed protein product [Rhizoctonia solani]|uniref:Endonuclease/exonuclease/phosphatase domain-containing protein n=1 Tax=Rhizoctonia solani TaxID=456999 RepID=A0A8H3BGD1_9AGAM|nr:unnamed protein product [Rhizoctonia solani]